MPPKKGGKKGGSKKKDAASKGPLDPVAEYQQRVRMQLQLRLRFTELYEEEQRMSDLSIREIRMRWMDWLRNEKYASIVKEIELVAHAHDKALDRKNAVLAMLLRDLTETEEQYSLALRTHLRNVDVLLDMQQRKARDLHSAFETRLLDLRSTYERENAEIVRRHDQERAHLEQVMANMQAEADAMEKHMEINFATQREETSERSSDELHMLTTQLEFEIRDLQREIQLKNEEYQNKAGDKMKTYQDKSKKDKKQAESITIMMRRISKLQEQIKNTKANGNNNIKECEERNEAMRRERDAIAGHFKDLKNHMQRWRAAQERHLSNLVAAANNSKKALQEHTEQAGRILRLDRRCRDLETERERFLGPDNDISVTQIAQEVRQRKQQGIDAGDTEKETFGADPRDDGADPNVRGDDMAENGSAGDKEEEEESHLMLLSAGLDDVADGEVHRLRALLRRYNKVLLDNAAVAQEKFHLENENVKLKQLLKQYLDGISITPQIMSENRTNQLLHITHMATNAQEFSTTHHHQQREGNGNERGRGAANAATLRSLREREAQPTVIEGVAVVRDLIRQRC